MKLEEVLDARDAEFVQGIMGLAEVNMAHDGYLTPVGMVVAADRRCVVVALDMSDEDAKDRSAVLLKALARRSNALLVLVMVEGWVYRVPKDMALDDAVERVKRGEARGGEDAVCITVATPRVEVAALAPITREAGKVTGFGEPEWHDRCDGRFHGFFAHVH